MKIIIFDISGEYAHFRKFNTTSSPLTYMIPTRTALSGLLGAVSGLGREEYYQIFMREKAFFAVQILSPLKKQGISFNLINTKEGMNRIKSRTQVKFEFVKDPLYRIFFSHADNDLADEIVRRISDRDYKFYPYLGLAQLAADLSLKGESEAVKKTAGEDTTVDIITAVNLKKCLPAGIRIDPRLRYSSAVMPLEILPDLNELPDLRKKPVKIPKDRFTNDFAEIIHETSGMPIQAWLPEYYEVEGYGNISFL
ncbi:MAG: type I-B CRISPR-associated protein Cas5 [Ignavibacteriaceae bacterium]|nr:type I-B CRISPR-associated protein Cas5 [Ignavibacteriaceae bacterium]